MLTIGVMHMKQTNLRLPIDLVSWVKQMAKQRHQSMNAFFYYRIGTIKKRGTERIDKKVIIFIRQKV